MELVRPNEPTDLKRKVKVELSLEELAVIFAVFADESTSSTQEKVEEKGFDIEIDCWENDLPYNIYRDAERILNAEGIETE